MTSPSGPLGSPHLGISPGDGLGSIPSDSSHSRESNNEQHLVVDIPSSLDLLRHAASPYEAHYVLRPEACKSASDIEFALGLTEGALKDDQRNKTTLREDQAKAYVRGDWALLPDKPTLDKVVVSTWLDTVSPKYTVYNELSLDETYVYDAIYFQKDASITAGPQFRLHVHPCYVMCDTAQKVQFQKYDVPDAALKRRINACSAMYSGWLIAHLPRTIMASRPPAGDYRQWELQSDDENYLTEVPMFSDPA
ncbi:hypothetical protein RhiJN_22307 [Ceratobasidium sp. AG-Ba]|nr:hypothetical protein RhiJN_22307 [Ceratobasidium sp. AG-Ba]